MSDRLANVTALPDRAVPTRIGTLVFETKAALLRLRRAGADLSLDAPRRHRRGNDLIAAPVLATIRSPLWTTRGGAKDRALNAGKIQNLRAAIAGLDGIEVAAGEVLSFWKQVGKPLRRRGFVEGRELREGCMIATVGGGLCQLSNALLDRGRRRAADPTPRRRAGGEGPAARDGRRGGSDGDRGDRLSAAARLGIGHRHRVPGGGEPVAEEAQLCRLYRRHHAADPALDQRRRDDRARAAARPAGRDVDRGRLGDHGLRRHAAIHASAISG